MKYDIAIIGNGILSQTIAYKLKKINKDIKIAVIGKSNRIGSATNAAGAMINCFAELNKYIYQSPYSKSKFDFTYKAYKMWDVFTDELKNETGLNIEQKKGTFVILNNKSGQLDSDNYKCIIDELDKYKEKYEYVENSKIVGLNPNQDCRPLSSIFINDEGYINPINLLSAIEHYNTNNGVEYLDYNADSVCIESNNIFRISANNLKIEANKVVIANGAYAQKIIDTIPELNGKIPPIFAGVGYATIVDQVEKENIQHVIRTPNRAGACGLHALPYGKHLYIGATNNVRRNPISDVSCGLINFLINCGIEQINRGLYNSNLHAIKTGNRAISIDTMPLIGKTSISGLYIVTGTYRDGLTQAPLISDYMANLIANDIEIIENIFQPERKPFNILNKDQSIDEFVEHYIAGSYEHGIIMPKFMPVGKYEKMIRDTITQKMEEEKINIGLMPEILLMLDFGLFNR